MFRYRGDFAGDLDHVNKVHTQLLVANGLLMVCGDAAPDVLGLGEMALHEHGTTIDHSLERIATEQSCGVVQDDQVHVLAREAPRLVGVVADGGRRERQDENAAAKRGERGSHGQE